MRPCPLRKRISQNNFTATGCRRGNSEVVSVVETITLIAILYYRFKRSCFSVLESSFRARLMISAKSTFMASAIRKTVSKVGFLIPRSTYPIIWGERPDSWAMKYFESLRRSRSFLSKERAFMQSAWAFRFTRYYYKRIMLTVHFTMVK
jgi:hypothetical protein